MIKTRFESFGLYLPERIVTTQELVEGMKVKPIFDLEQLTGIRTRRFRGENENSFSMAVESAQDCLKRSRYAASDVEAIIFTSITHFKNREHFYVEPAMSLFIKNEIGATRAMNFDISNACAGMLSGAYILDNMIRAGVVKNGMVVSGEAISHIAETALKEIKDPVDDQFASLTVGDSSAAFIMDRASLQEPGIDFVDIMTAADFAHLCLGMPSTENPGIAMYAKSSEMHKMTFDRWPIFLEEVFRRQGKIFDPEDYDYIIFHQTAERAIRKYMKCGKEYFKKDMPEPLYSVNEFGNTSTTTHFLALYDNLKKSKVKAGSRVLLIGLASGMIFAALSTTIGSLEI